MLTFRPATLHDAAAEADVLTALFPDEPLDPGIVRSWWEMHDPDATVDRHMALRDVRVVGYVGRTHPAWEKMPERFDELAVDLLPTERDALGQGYDFIEERSRRDGAALFAAAAREDDAALAALLRVRGYREERRSRAWELDLRATGPRLREMSERYRARMREQRIAILTLDRDTDPDKLRKLYDMSEEAALDVPRTIPHVRESFETFMKWFATPGIREDRMWIARQGDELVGVSVLLYPPARGNVWTDWTGTARRVRGRGVARALKLETLMQAVALGVERVRTENDGENAPILHLNEELGYVRIPGWVQYVKAAR